MFVLAFIEDGKIEVFASRESAASKFDGIDVESGTVQFFEEDGTPLKAEFTSPDPSGRRYGPAGLGPYGQYSLVPDRESNDDALALALFEASALEPNVFFASIENLKSMLRAAGGSVDYIEPSRKDEA